MVDNCKRKQEEEARVIYAAVSGQDTDAPTCSPCTPSRNAGAAPKSTCTTAARSPCTCTTATAVTQRASIAPVSSGKRQSDYQLKENAYSVPLMFLNNLKCDKTCEYGSMCLKKASLETIFQLRTAFWGEENTLPPSSGQRRAQIVDILRTAYSGNEKKFVFTVPDKNSSGGKRAVCQLAFLHTIGLTTKSTLAEAPSQWKRCRDSILSGIVQPETKYKVSDKPKYRHAIAYIRFITDKIADTTPYGGTYVHLF